MISHVFQEAGNAHVDQSVFDSFVTEKVIRPETSYSLQWACYWGSEKPIKVLFEGGASVEERNEVYKTSLLLLVHCSTLNKVCWHDGVSFSL